ncbi:MAG: hypothetical protein JRD43_05485 [Deltaproteobacteria bacterium]|nr:hypothetical protein [Deltaproteobacteria bacterium]MBW2594733.1 hypothetical protein [Deltaproteobacteria bacterium]MBW2649890.1 hypothetical protein [Deltaproteobacteria bacterium]
MNKKNILICLVLLMISGCISGKIPEFTKGAVAFPENVLGKIAMPGSGDIIRAIANITLISSEGRYSRKMALLLKTPSYLHIETMPIFGPADFFLSANEESFKVFLPGKGRFYVGKATRENLFLFFKVLISPGDMVSILAGLPPQIMEGNLSEYVEGRLYRVDIRSGKRKWSLWVNPDDYTLTKVEEIDDGRIIYRATFKDPVIINGIPYPERIDIEVEEPERANISIRYLDLEISHDEDAAAFDLRTPSGVVPVFID